MTIRGARLLTAALAVAMLVAALTGYVVSRASGSPTGRCQDFAQASAARLAHDAGTASRAPRIVVIGDSYSVGLSLDHPSRSWPSRLVKLPARVHVAGFSGSGFGARSSPCGKVSYADRAPAAVRGGASLVVVEGGLNDWDQSAASITAGFDRLFGELGGLRVVVVGPARAPSRAEQAVRVDAVLARLCAQHGVRYVSMTGVRLSYLPDDLHPTQAGQDAFGDRVEAALVEGTP